MTPVVSRIRPLGCKTDGFVPREDSSTERDAKELKKVGREVEDLADLGGPVLSFGFPLEPQQDGHLKKDRFIWGNHPAVG